MFRKKESAARPLAAVQILTPDYLVEGYIDVDDSGWPFGPVKLTSVRFEPTGSLTPPATTAANWYVLGKSPVVAAIPRDESILAHTQKRYPNEKYPLAAELYVGPYLIQGIVLRSLEETDPLTLMSTLDEYVVVQDVAIDCLLPGTRLKRLSAPLALVSTENLLHGFVVLQ